MMLIGTIIVLTLWFIFVWILDPDGFRRRPRRRRYRPGFRD